MTFPLWAGESLRWYLKRARHPFKDYLVGHYWGLFCKPRVWIKYGEESRISVCLNDYMQEQIFFHGYYEKLLLAWLARALRPTDVFWDVGANIGAVSLVAAKVCAHVVAFEPDPRSIQLLTQHVNANRLKNVEVAPFALGDRGGESTLYQSRARNTGRSSLLRNWAEAASETRVRIRTADEFVQAFPQWSPSIIKIDVEGAEALVLAGATALLGGSTVRAVVFEDRKHGSGPANAALVRQLHAVGYDVQPLGPSIEGWTEAALENETFNFLALPITPP